MSRGVCVDQINDNDKNDVRHRFYQALEHWKHALAFRIVPNDKTMSPQKYLDSNN